MRLDPAAIRDRASDTAQHQYAAVGAASPRTQGSAGARLVLGDADPLRHVPPLKIHALASTERAGRCRRGPSLNT